MKIDFNFNIGEKVYYCIPSSCNREFRIQEGEIFGFSCFKSKNGIDKRVNFKEYNGVPIEYVKKTLKEAEIVKREMYGKCYYK